MKKGFTLIELLVVIVIIGVLVAIALPNFIKIKDKAKEAEVKQNLHSIQLAVERYAVDSGSSYPYFLYGGDPAVNMGTVWKVHGTVPNPAGTGMSGVPNNAFDPFWSNLSWDYADTNWNDLLSGAAGAAFGDTLQYEGYLPKYPRNPFASANVRYMFGAQALGNGNATYVAGHGGRDGGLMFNTAPTGDQPRTVIQVPVENWHNQFNGHFYYHPRWQDGATNAGHYQHQVLNRPGSTAMFGASIPLLNDNADVFSLEVAGYDLVAIGSIRTRGQDLDVSMTGLPPLAKTGYLVMGQEKNPYVVAGQYDGVGDYGERPTGDGIPDMLIIHLGAGMDRKVSMASDT